MIEVYQSEFLKLEINEQLSLMKITWKSNTSYMSESEYRTNVFAIGETYDKFKTKRILTDIKNASYAVSPKMQEWTVKNLFYKYVGNVERSAFITSKHFFSQLSAEQILEEDKKRDFPTRFFEDEEDANYWLLS